MIVRTIFLALSLCGLLGLVPAFAQNTNAPPRNVDDIFALLDQYTDNPESEKNVG